MNRTILISIFILSGLLATETGVVLFTDSDGTEVLTYLEGEDLYVEVEDADRNEDESVSEVITLMVSSQTETGGETLTLIETGPSTGTFMGSMSFEEASANSGDGVLQVARGDELTAAYLDPADDFGNEVTITDVAYYRVTLKSGPLTESETWSPDGSPYLVTGDVTVASDQALTIEPGVEVRFTELSDDQGGGQDANRAELYVYGTILAEGTEADSIIFTSNSQSPASGDWYGIYLRESNANGSFKYNRIEYATYGIRLQELYGSTSEDTIRVTNNRIHHSGTGLYSYYSNRYEIIENNNFHDLSGYGIYNSNWTYNGAGVIRRNTLRQCNGSSIIIQAQGPYTISRNKIDGGNGHGMELSYMRGVTVRQDTIQNKGGYGIQIERSTGYATSQWKVVSNVIEDNGYYGMRIAYASVNVDSNTISGHNGACGVYVNTDFESPAADTLRYNTIINNGNYGIYVDDYAGPFVQYNDLYGHSEYDYYNNSTTGNELDARYNWWGEETTAEMDAGGNPKDIEKIYDYYDDNSLSFVNYGGWLGASNESLTIDYLAEWNMIGLPLEVEDASSEILFPESVDGTLFSFNDGYVSEAYLTPGEGYWLRFADAGSATIAGAPIDELSIGLNEDWNLISGLTEDVSIYSISDPGNIIVPGTFFGYNDILGYYEAEVMSPGKGYWLRAHEAGEITLTSGALAKTAPKDLSLKGRANTLTINGMDLYFGVDISGRERLSYSLPPKPPAGALDVRFKGDTRIAALDKAEIEIMSPYKSLTISCDVILDAGEHITWVLTSESGEEYILEGTGEIIVPTEETFTLERKEIIPITYTLHQNYPNPFNPITSLRYDLPEQAQVILTVYDLIGREVTQLVNTAQEAGYRSVQWNATDMHGKPVSAGVYLYQIRAGEFVQTRKMVLLK